MADVARGARRLSLLRAPRRGRSTSPSPRAPAGPACSVRPATHADAALVARLHADGWRRHYRGAYADRYLGEGLDTERLEVWTSRLRSGAGATVTLVAEAGGDVVGFVHVELDAEGGALVDNLHVAHGFQGVGIGTALLGAAADAVVSARPGSRLWLWVLEQNRDAQAFYRARGASFAETVPPTPPGGDPAALAGAPRKIRVVWPDPTVLVGRP